MYGVHLIFFTCEHYFIIEKDIISEEMIFTGLKAILQAWTAPLLLSVKTVSRFVHLSVLSPMNM